MDEHSLHESIEQLKADETLDVRVSKRKKSNTPPYLIIGNGKSNRHFKDAPVRDTLRDIGSLSPQQLDIFLHFRDVIVDNHIRSIQAKSINAHPNTVILSSSEQDEEAKKIKALLRANNNAKKMQEQGLIKKVKSGVYMVNPFVIIPSDHFQEVVDAWDAIV